MEERFEVRLCYTHAPPHVYRHVREGLARVPLKVVYTNDELRSLVVEVPAKDEDEAVGVISRGLYKVNGRDDYLDIYVRNVERVEPFEEG